MAKTTLTEAQKKQYNQIAKQMGKQTIQPTGEQKTASQSFQDQVREKRMAEYNSLAESIRRARESGRRSSPRTWRVISQES